MSEVQKYRVTLTSKSVPSKTLEAALKKTDLFGELPNVCQFEGQTRGVYELSSGLDPDDLGEELSQRLTEEVPEGATVVAVVVVVPNSQRSLDQALLIEANDDAVPGG